MDDLKWIKKHYGEEMSHFCRGHFQKLLETEGLLSSLLEKHFVKSKSLFKDIASQRKQTDFIRFINSQHQTKQVETESVTKSAVELMSEAGYILYPECKTEEEIQAFARYYREDEVICTIHSGGRLEDARVWFAVKKNVDDIKRENFTHPQRQDEYGTSVISIQFSRGSYVMLSIKNRYNHTVPNCDNTFNNNLDNIIPGLTEAFEQDYGAKCTNEYANDSFELDNYVNVGNKYYKYNYEINDIYYCPNNTIIKHGEVIQLPNSQMLVDYFVFDFQNNKVTLFDEMVFDCFTDTIGKIEKLNFKDNVITIKLVDGSDILIKLNEQRQIVSITDFNLTHCDDNYLFYSESVEEVNTENLISCGSNFIPFSKHIKHANFPNLRTCGNSFLEWNTDVETINMPNLEKCGDSFFHQNQRITDVYLPKLKRCGQSFFSFSAIESLDLPELEVCGHLFVSSSEKLSKVNLPKLERCGNLFLRRAPLEHIDFPELYECGNSFMSSYKGHTSLHLPKLERCGVNFLASNIFLRSLSLPSLRVCEDNFMINNKIISELNLPKLTQCGDEFLPLNENLTELNLPSLKICRSAFLTYNKKISSINLPELERCEYNFLIWNHGLETINLPKLYMCGYNFFGESRKIKHVDMPNLQACGDNFMMHAKNLEDIYVPKLEIVGDNFLLTAPEHIRSQFNDLTT